MAEQEQEFLLAQYLPIAILGCVAAYADSAFIATAQGSYHPQVSAHVHGAPRPIIIAIKWWSGHKSEVILKGVHIVYLHGLLMQLIKS